METWKPVSDLGRLRRIAPGQRTQPGRVNARLNEDKVRRIRTMHADGCTQTALARSFGVSQGTVWSVVKGKGWPHVS